MNKAMTKIVLARREAGAGVDFTARHGATCPFCNKRSTIYRTLPWDDTTRIRYHRCDNIACPLAKMRITIKSIEVDA